MMVFDCLDTICVPVEWKDRFYDLLILIIYWVTINYKKEFWDRQMGRRLTITKFRNIMRSTLRNFVIPSGLRNFLRTLLLLFPTTRNFQRIRSLHLSLIQHKECLNSPDIC